MLHAGLDLSRKRLDVSRLSDQGELVAEIAAPPDADGLRGLVGRVARYRHRLVTDHDRCAVEQMRLTIL